MNKILILINQVKNITREQIIDIVISIILIILFWIISKAIAYAIVRLIKIKEKNKKKLFDNSLYNPIKWIIRVTGIYIAIAILQIPDDFEKLLIQAYKIACIIIIAKGVTDLFHPKATIFKKLEEKTKYSGDKVLNNFVSKIIKAGVYLVAGYLILLELGYNLGGLATGLGITSVVFALAAQDLAKNLFGGFAIIVDKPFIVGDYIETKEFTGTVVDITFRSTRVRELDNTLVTIQNSTIAGQTVKNWTKMKKRRYEAKLNLPLEMSKEKIEKLINKIEFIFKTNKEIIPESLEVHFEAIDKEAIQIFIFFNTTNATYSDFEYFKDKINLELIDILNSENVKLLYPTRNVCVNTIAEIEGINEE